MTGCISHALRLLSRHPVGTGKKNGVSSKRLNPQARILPAMLPHKTASKAALVFSAHSFIFRSSN